MFGINGSELVIIVLVALFIFGPDKLPGAAKQAASLLRDVRRWTARTRADLTGQLGPEFENFDLADLNPKRFVQKHLLEGLDLDDEPAKTPVRTPAPTTDSDAVEAVGATAVAPTAVAGSHALGSDGPAPASGDVDWLETATSVVPESTVGDGVATVDTRLTVEDAAASGRDPVAASRPHVDFDAT